MKLNNAGNFNNAWNKIQSKMGMKPSNPREVKKNLNQEDFMKIVIAQMQHQDPTKPFDSDKLASEISQIASVEQMKDMSMAIKSLGDKNKPSERLAAAGLIGRTVTVDQSRFIHEKGNIQNLEFNLPMDAAKVKIVIIDEKGESVKTEDLGSMGKGINSYNWNGIKKNTLHADSGSYRFIVEALDDRDTPIRLERQKKLRVIGVDFIGDKPVFLVGTKNNNFRVDFNQISRIEETINNMSPGRMNHYVENNLRPNVPIGGGN